MLFMVIESFKDGKLRAIKERFQRHGRMLPEDVRYVNSWVEATGSRCFQVMEAPSQGSLQPWIERWSDLVDLEVIPILTSAGFWQTIESA
jgi:hypothetical protein